LVRVLALFEDPRRDQVQFAVDDTGTFTGAVTLRCPRSAPRVGVVEESVPMTEQFVVAFADPWTRRLPDLKRTIRSKSRLLGST
jgi:hypothetical protein